MSVTETDDPAGEPRKHLLPADYYSSPTPVAILPKWATFGCGGAAVLAMLVIFGAGAFLASGGMVDLMDMVFGMTVGEVRGMYGTDVTPARQAALEAEIETLRKHLRDGKISVQSLDPVLQAMRKAIADKKITAEEAEAITGSARAVNAKRKP